MKVQQTCCSVLANLYHSRALSKSQCQGTSSHCHKLRQAAAAATGQHDPSAKVNWLYEWYQMMATPGAQKILDHYMAVQVEPVCTAAR